MNPRPTLTPSQAQAIQARFAMRVTARLDDSVSHSAFPHDLGERLRVARMQAVSGVRVAAVAAALAPSRVAALQASPALAGVGASLGGAAGGFQWVSDHGRAADHGRRLDEGPTSWGWRIASALPVVALLAGLWGVGHWNDREQVLAAVEVDTALLTDDLPPSAYVDPGFEEFLKSDMPARQETTVMSDDSLTDPVAPSKADAAVDMSPASRGSGANR